jgi:hypothetical protein
MKKAYFLPIACVFMLAVASATDCPPAPAYPPAGSDYMNGTTAIIELQILGPYGFTETITTMGPTNVSRSDEYKPPDNRSKIDTEMVSLNLMGTSPHIGPITIIESPSRTSNGTVQEIVSEQYFPSTSFFDVFVEIHTTLPPPLQILHNDAPANMSAIIDRIPPWGSNYTMPIPIQIPLKDQNNNTIGYINHVTHKIPPIPSGGGIALSVDKLSLLASYIGLASTIVVATAATTAYLKRIKRKK